MTKKKNNYPEWKVFSELVDDPFWKGKFNKSSRGRFQTGYSYDSGNFIFSDNKKKSETINVLELKRKNVYLAIETIIDMYHRNTYTYSPLEQQELDKLAQVRNKNIDKEFSDWNNLNKYIKTSLISDFVLDFIKNQNSDLKFKNLYIFIKDAIDAGCEVTLNNNKIETISDIVWDEETQTIFCDLLNTTNDKPKPLSRISIDVKKTNSNKINPLLPYQKRMGNFFLKSH